MKRCESSQKIQIEKKNTRRELLSFKEMDKSTSSNWMDMRQRCNCDNTYVFDDLAELKDHVVTATNLLLAAVGMNYTGLSKVKNHRT